MKILVTGATGYVGARVAALLAKRGDDVRGLVRDASRISALPAGVRPIVADLAQVDAVVAHAAGMDAVIHTGFAAHGRAWADAVASESALVDALAQQLRGAPTRLIVSNGTAFYGDAKGRFLDETRSIDETSPGAIRWRATRSAHTTPGLHGMELRLASFVYGHGGSVFLPILVAHARAHGRSLYVADGANRVSAVHVDAAAAAYVAALDHGQAGAIYHIASDEAPAMRDLAHAIAIGTGAEMKSVSQEEAARALDPFTAMFLALDNGLDSRRARVDLGWSPAGAPGLLWDVAYGSYARA